MLRKTINKKTLSWFPIFKSSTIRTTLHQYRFNSTQQFVKTKDGKIVVTLFEGHGIGPEISSAVVKIFDAANAGIAWEPQQIGIPVGDTKELVSKEAIESVLKNKLALKGPLATPSMYSKNKKIINHYYSWKRISFLKYNITTSIVTLCQCQTCKKYTFC